MRMDGVYLLGGSRHADITTSVVHEGTGGGTSQIVKGVAADTSRGVFQGRIVVSVGAEQTDARMRHDAILLSDRAEIDAKPELEIYADDVACAHGNTVGALDAETLFYIQARGVPEAQAKALLLRAHLGEVVERISHEGVRDRVGAWIEQRLERLAGWTWRRATLCLILRSPPRRAPRRLRPRPRVPSTSTPCALSSRSCRAK